MTEARGEAEHDRRRERGGLFISLYLTQEKAWRYLRFISLYLTSRKKRGAICAFVSPPPTTDDDGAPFFLSPGGRISSTFFLARP